MLHVFPTSKRKVYGKITFWTRSLFGTSRPLQPLTHTHTHKRISTHEQSRYCCCNFFYSFSFRALNLLFVSYEKSSVVHLLFFFSYFSISIYPPWRVLQILFSNVCLNDTKKYKVLIKPKVLHTNG